MREKNYGYSRQYIDEDDINAVVEVLKSNFLTTGPKVAEFEEAIKRYLGVQYAVCVSSGTASLHIAAICLLEKGDKVLTTPNSFLATSNAIVYAQAVPIFVDVDAQANIDLNLCEAMLKKDNTIKAIFAVDFAGNMVDPKGLSYLSEKYGVKILEDCAHSLGASFGAHKAGDCSFCDVATLSFHPVKSITSAEGGCIVTNSEAIAKKASILRNHGIVRNSSEFIYNDDNPLYFEMQDLGFNYRLSDVHSALGLSQLKKIDFFLTTRRKLAQNYDKVFDNTSIRPLYKNASSSYHLYVIRVNFKELGKKRADIMKSLKSKGIMLQTHYIPINAQPFYQKMGYNPLSTPKALEYYNECLSIPLYVGLEDNEQEFIIDAIKSEILY
ncbi:Bacillosamine/Legionaminic acid biosynthesis aminotransferase PglE [Desulfurella amilsii]|uniref:Bacillosamine/Legionaminic acid biosynthesis aminotransferase PglE n=1 Tax=Desulfurella amilsii TaxID=1562698 RepID=A0A1X4XXN5_9BACT|nr:UDP-4-amino-4,6-dideoxy-N-acetyl-beta-L-altrosamine transaminase [Desulfurella amilsii]OSS42302.1 Bacillosamine/Legionaminic acid biosynthesis aminotransferase PglE [Desulfurella amilsii]